MIGRVKAAYPNAKVFATTLRQVVNANTHLWGAIMLAGDEWHVVEPREIRVLDRIGGGNGFVGGLLYAALKGCEAGEVDTVRLGKRRPCHHLPHRLRPARRSGYGLERLERQRQGQKMTSFITNY